MMAPELIDGELPFTIGSLPPLDQYVHVVDDFTFDAILKTVDTAADLAQYFQRKEEFIRSGKLKYAAGEEELLAYYLQRADTSGCHHFEVPASADGIIIDEGRWDRFCKHPDRRAQVDADRVSYAWDELIQEFTKHLLGGTQYFNSGASLSQQEVGLRLMAAENRTRRRMLANSLFAILERAEGERRSARVMTPSAAGEPYYLFLALQRPTDVSEADYRVGRRNLLEWYCMVVRAQYPDASAVVGIATEPMGSQHRSEDLLYLDGTVWSDELQREALDLQERHNLLQEVRKIQVSVSEYPQQLGSNSGRDRNKQCPCGSGRKVKK